MAEVHDELIISQLPGAMSSVSVEARVAAMTIRKAQDQLVQGPDVVMESAIHFYGYHTTNYNKVPSL